MLLGIQNQIPYMLLGIPNQIPNMLLGIQLSVQCSANLYPII